MKHEIQIQKFIILILNINLVRYLSINVTTRVARTKYETLKNNIKLNENKKHFYTLASHFAFREKMNILKYTHVQNMLKVKLLTEVMHII